MTENTTSGEKIARINELTGEVQRLSREVALLRAADKGRLEQMRILQEAYGRVSNELAAYKHEARSDNWVDRDLGRLRRGEYVASNVLRSKRG